MELDRVIFYNQPSLRKPDMVVAFLGWPDAAQVATGAASYLINKLQARKFAEMKSEDYYDFSIVRPVVNIENGLIQPLRLPENSFHYWLNTAGVRDLIIVTGIEPQLKWQAYVQIIVDMAVQYGVNHVYAIGSLFDRIPHTREPHISALVNDLKLMYALDKANLEPINYHGPSSIHGLLLNECALRHIPAISIWGRVPFYMRADFNPAVCLEVIRKIAHLCELEIDTGDLAKAATNLSEMLDRWIAENEQMRTFLTTLEEQYDREGSSLNIDVPDDAQIIKDIEEFLKNQRQDG